MLYEPEQAWKWRLRAEELRVRAEATADPQAKATFLALAKSWDDKAAASESPPFLRPPLRD